VEGMGVSPRAVHGGGGDQRWPRVDGVSTSTFDVSGSVFQGMKGIKTDANGGGRFFSSSPWSRSSSGGAKIAWLWKGSELGFRREFLQNQSSEGSFSKGFSY
jgi:hypothetical protein